MGELRRHRGPAIVALGGGHGLSAILRGLKLYTDDLTAIVTVADDGGGSGVLREDLGMPPPGDIRNCMEALADTESLMQRLLDAGYPLEEMDHHESDLYVFVTPLTTKVIEQWCREHEYNRAWHCPTFYDQETGRLMFDCVFQYTDWWVEKAESK